MSSPRRSLLAIASLLAIGLGSYAIGSWLARAPVHVRVPESDTGSDDGGDGAAMGRVLPPLPEPLRTTGVGPGNCAELARRTKELPTAVMAATLLESDLEDWERCFDSMSTEWQWAILDAWCHRSDSTSKSDLGAIGWAAITRLVRSDRPGNTVRPPRSDELESLPCLLRRIIANGNDVDLEQLAKTLAWLFPEPEPAVGTDAIRSILKMYLLAHPTMSMSAWKRLWNAEVPVRVRLGLRSDVLRSYLAERESEALEFVRTALEWPESDRNLAIGTETFLGVALTGSRTAIQLMNSISDRTPPRLLHTALVCLPRQNLWPSTSVPWGMTGAPLARLDAALLYREDESAADRTARLQVLRNQWELMGHERASGDLYSRLASGVGPDRDGTAAERVAAAVRIMVRFKSVPEALQARMSGLQDALKLAASALRDGYAASNPVELANHLDWLRMNAFDAAEWKAMREFLDPAVEPRLRELPPAITKLFRER